MGFPNPVSKQTNRQSSHQSDMLFLILRENKNSWQQDKELSVLRNMLVCLSFSLERIHCLRFEILFLLSRSLSKVKVNEGRRCSMDER